MRVSQSMTFRMLTRQVFSAQRREMRAQEKIAGTHLLRASGDPKAVSRLSTIDGSFQQLKGMETASQRTQETLQVASVALGNMVDVMSSAYELAVRANNNASNPKDFPTHMQELSNLRESFIALANTKQGSTYVFSGINTHEPAMDSTGAFKGSREVNTVEVLPGVRMESAVSGAYIFDTDGGINIVSAMDRFYSAMQNSDLTAMHEAIDTMQSGMEQVLSYQVRSGMLLARAQNADTLREEMKSALTEEKAVIGSVDPVVSVSELSQSHIALQLAMSQLQRMMQTLEG